MLLAHDARKTGPTERHLIPIDDMPQRRRTHFPGVTVFLLVANVFVSVYSVSLGSGYGFFLQSWGLTPAEITTGRDVGVPTAVPVYLTLFTSLFLHAGILHLAGNMIFLWVFGDNVEDTFGHIGFIGFYLACGIIASLFQIISDPMSQIPNVGASGAIAGVLAAYLLLFPGSVVRTLLFIGPFITFTRVSAFLLILIWLAFQLVSALLELGFATDGSSVAFWAHIGGFAAGFAIAALWKLSHHLPLGTGV